MPVKHLFLFQTLGPGGHHILLADLIEERVLGQQGEGGKATDDIGRYRQCEVPEVISDFLVPGKFIEIGRRQPPQRKPVQITAPCEQDDQQYRKQEAWYGVTHHDGRTAPDVESRSVGDRLADAEGDRDQVDDQGGPQPQGDGHRHLVQNQFDHRTVPKKGLAKIKGGVIPEHLQESLVGRLVEAVHNLYFFEQLFRQATGAAAVAT